MLFADVDAAHTGFRRKFDKGGFHFGNFLAAQAEFIFRQHDDAPSLSRFVGNGRKLRRFRKIAFRSIPHGNKFACLSVAERDRTRFIQQQNIDVSAASIARPLVASTFALFNRAIPAIPIEESNAPIVVGARHTSNATILVRLTGDPCPA